MTTFTREIQHHRAAGAEPDAQAGAGHHHLHESGHDAHVHADHFRVVHFMSTTMPNLSVMFTPGAPVPGHRTPAGTSAASRSSSSSSAWRSPTVILGATMAAMNDAIKATDGAMLLANMNNGLRTSMDLIVRDMLQVGQGLPAGRVIMIPNGVGALGIRLPGPPGTNLTLPGAAGLAATSFSAVVPGPGLGPAVIPGIATDMITTLQADSAFEGMDITHAHRRRRRQRQHGGQQRPASAGADGRRHQHLEQRAGRHPPGRPHHADEGAASARWCRSRGSPDRPCSSTPTIRCG